MSKNTLKNNIKYIISYLMIILFFMLAAVFYRQPFLAVLFILLLILPVISIYVTYIFSQKVSISIECASSQITTGNNIILKITICNKSIIPFPNCELPFKVQNLFYSVNDNSSRLLVLSARPLNSLTVEVPIETSHCGMNLYTFPDLYITDPLHLYTRSFSINKTIQIPVFPDEVHKNFPIFPGMYFDDENDEYLNYSGQTSNDIKEIREYRPGDQLTSIHWKITAKEDELMVKEMEMVAPRTLLIIPEFEAANIDTTISTLYSYMIFLLSKGEIFKVGLYNYKQNSFDLYLVSNLVMCNELMLKIFFTPVYDANTKGLIYKADSLAAETFSELYGQSDAFLSGSVDGNCFIHIYGDTIIGNADEKNGIVN